ncbi:TPA_asm: P11 [Alnus trirhavirus 1]|nr:TPA_asm: P11 [Alnus trirhavirus 1]
MDRSESSRDRKYIEKSPAFKQGLYDCKAECCEKYHSWYAVNEIDEDKMFSEQYRHFHLSFDSDVDMVMSLNSSHGEPAYDHDLEGWKSLLSDSPIGDEEKELIATRLKYSVYIPSPFHLRVMKILPPLYLYNRLIGFSYLNHLTDRILSLTKREETVKRKGCKMEMVGSEQDLLISINSEIFVRSGNQILFENKVSDSSWFKIGFKIKMSSREWIVTGLQGEGPESMKIYKEAVPMDMISKFHWEKLGESLCLWINSKLVAIIRGHNKVGCVTINKYQLYNYYYENAKI